MKNLKLGRSSRSQLARSIRPTIETVEQRILLSTYTVNTTSDAANPGAGLLTLRQAVANANSNPGPDTIAFDPTVFTPGILHTITLTQGQIEFFDGSGTTTVNGPGSNVLAINGNKLSRVANISITAQVSLSGLTITGGQQTEFDENGNTYGGAIYSAGTLTISNSAITGNSVIASVDAIDQPFQEIPGLGWGGAIYSTGSLMITGSTLSSNTVTNTAPDMGDFQNGPEGDAYGGAIYATGTLVLSGDTITNNTATAHSASPGGFEGGTAGGGGIYATAAVAVTGSTISGNTAQAGNGSAGGDAGDANGGGLYAGGILQISGSIITNNSALAGASSGSDDEGDAGGAEGGGVYGGASVAVSNSSVSNNLATGNGSEFGDPSAGGGVYSAGSTTITQDTIDGNTLTGSPPGFTSAPSAAGGGVYAGGILAIQESSISGNNVTTTYSGFYQDGGLSVGGGVAAEDDATINSSTIANNSVTGGHGYSDQGNPNYATHPGGAGLGGGVYGGLGDQLTITNSTVYGNTATGGAGGDVDSGEENGSDGGNGAGGGIYTSSLTLADSTVTGNSSTGGTGGKINFYGEQFFPGKPGAAYGGGVLAEDASLTNSILSADRADGAFNDFVGIVSNGISDNNLIGVGRGITEGGNDGLTNGVNGNLVGINNPQLLPLANYGGPTETMLPMPGSPAIDAGNNSLIPSGDNSDQRGFPRISGKAVDIGATEFQIDVFGTVFNDTNGNGAQTPGESGIPGVTVYADLNNNGNLDPGEPHVVTGSAGQYTLLSLPLGSFLVRQVLPAGYRQTSPSSNLGQHVSTTPVPVVTNINFQDTTKTFISGTVFNDTNKNGKQDSNEPGLAGWTIYADLNNDGKFESNEPGKTVGANGNFSFVALNAGSYIFRVLPPPGWTQTFPTNNLGQHATLSAGGTASSINFGFAQNSSAASISGSVFNDANGNGIQNSGELGLSGWTVYIDLTNSGTLQNADPTTTTDSTGNFTFTNLTAGTYILRIISPTGWSQTLPTKNFGQHITVTTGQKVTKVLFGEKKA